MTDSLPTISRKLVQQRRDNLTQWVWTCLKNRLGDLDVRNYEEGDESLYMRDYKRRFNLAEEGADYIVLYMEVVKPDRLDAINAFVRYANEH